MEHKKFLFVAVAFDGSEQIPYFEKADAFWLYCMEDGKLKKRQFLSVYSKDTEAQIRRFKESMTDVLVCRNYSPKAMAVLKRNGLSLYTFEGGADAAYKALMNGELKPL